MKRRVAGRLVGSASAVLLLCACVARGQQYSITTVAGGAPVATPVTATSISIGQPRRMAADSAGNLYFTSGNCVYKINSSGSMSLVAGSGRPGFTGDNGPAVSAQLNLPLGLAVDSANNLYIADSVNNRIRIVTPNGTINTFAGNGSIGYPGAVGDAGQAIQAQLYLPGGVAVDSNNNLYIADTGHSLIREVTTDGNINSIAGDGYPGYRGDSQPAISGEINKPQDVAVDSKGQVYIADTGNSAVRIVYTTGVMNTFAGNYGIGYTGDGGIAYKASLTSPSSVAVDKTGNVYLTEPYDGTIRQVNTNGIINTIVGLDVQGFSGDGATASKALLNTPMGVAVDPSGNLYIADTLNNRIRKVVGFAGNISTLAGNGVLSYAGDGGPAKSALFNSPQGVAVDTAGNFYISDTGNNVVRKVSSNGTISNFAGNGTAGFGGDGNAATGAQLNAPQGIAVDSAGNVYIADTGNSRVRKVSGGNISTIAGSGTVGFGGDGASATAAALNSPTAVAVDSAGNVYIADFGNNVVRKVAGGTISTVAGNGRQGYSGDGGPGTQAQLNGPQGVAVDNAGNVYIADTLNSRIRMVSGSNIRTVAGIGIVGYAGDGGPAVQAQLAGPTGLAVDAAGSIYVSNGSSNVRKIYPNGPIATIAGANSLGYSGDGGLAINATFNGALGLAVDANGNVYVADSGNNAIRLLQPQATGTGISAVVNAASNQSGAIAPGEIIVIYGSGLGPASVAQNQPANGVYGTTVGGTVVYVGGIAAPILYASATQVSAIVPFGLSGSSASVYLTYQGIATTTVNVPVASASPALFTLDFSGSGQAAAVNEGATPSANGAAHPASAGTFVELYLTGGGTTNPSSADGAIATGPAPLSQALTVTVSIGGQNATVAYSGAAPGSPNGVVQINAQVPAGLTAGQAAVLVQIGGVTSPGGATIAVSGN